jgi:hypothetical protein
VDFHECRHGLLETRLDLQLNGAMRDPLGVTGRSRDRHRFGVIHHAGLLDWNGDKPISKEEERAVSSRSFAVAIGTETRNDS